MKVLNGAWCQSSTPCSITRIVTDATGSGLLSTDGTASLSICDWPSGLAKTWKIRVGPAMVPWAAAAWARVNGASAPTVTA